MLLALALALFFFVLSESAIMGSNLECGFINDALFCYDSRNSSLYRLSMQDSKSLSILDQQWESLDMSPNESRIYSSMIPLPDADSLMLYGGIGTAEKTLVNQTKIYHVDSGHWKKMSNYANPRSNISRQIMMASAVYVPKLGAVVFYGGQEVIPPTIDSNNSITRGFDLITLYNLGTNIWSLFSSQANMFSASSYPVSQTATFYPSKGNIVYLGGALASDQRILGLIPLSYGLMFNTNNGAWTNRTFGGKTPTSRIGHTATLMPNEDQILIYGGSSGMNGSLSVAVSDFCYTLNLSSMNWTEHSELYSTNNLAPRFNHSAVLIDSTVFILFGVGQDGTMISSLMGIDVSNPAMLSFVTAYTSNKNRLSAGAIAGIVVGLVVAVALLVLLIVFCVKRKLRKNKNPNMLASGFRKETIEVEWSKSELATPSNTYQSNTRPSRFECLNIFANEEDHTLAITASNSLITLENKESNTQL